MIPQRRLGFSRSMNTLSIQRPRRLLPLGSVRCLSNRGRYNRSKTDAQLAEDNRREAMLRVSEGAWHYTTAWASEGFVAGLKERLEDRKFRRLWLARVRCEPARLGEIQRGAEAFAELLASMLVKRRLRELRQRPHCQLVFLH